MNLYLYNVTIFDTAPDANLTVFPKIEPHTAIADRAEEAQRQIVEKIYDPELGGTCARYARKDDAADRFHIVFGKPEVERPVEWNEEIGEWIWADEPVDIQVATRRLAGAFKNN